MTGLHPATCQCCGTPLAADHLAWRYPVPDVIAKLSERDRARRIETATEAVLVADGLGAFFRALLPIRMDTGRSATLGVWLKIGDAETFYRVMDAGRAGGEAWASLSFEGNLANAVEPWPEVYRAAATAAVPAQETLPGGAADESLAVPRIVRSDHPQLSRLLTEQWPQAQFLESRSPTAQGGRPGAEAS